MRLAIAALFLIAVSALGQAPKSDIVTLNAADKHIVRDAYHDEEAITATGSDAGGWHLYAGAAIDARHIDLRMTNVHGVIRFRSDVRRLADLINRSKRREISERLR